MALTGSPQLTPTPDRLAKPTLPPSPSQADLGAQVFWLYCLPCHGERGQGLTEEFRQTYPPEDRNCWNSGCHGPHPYTNGWTLPDSVPAVIGPGAIANFPSAAALYGFLRAAMPFQRPGSLTDEQYYQLVAFLLRSNGYWDGPVAASNAAQIPIQPNAAAPQPSPVPPVQAPHAYLPLWAAAGAIFLGLLVVLALILRKGTRI